MPLVQLMKVSLFDIFALDEIELESERESETFSFTFKETLLSV